MPPFQSASSGTSVRLTGSDCGSAGSFWAVTVTGGSVTFCGGAGACALATAGSRTVKAKALKNMRFIMQRENAAKVAACHTTGPFRLKAEATDIYEATDIQDV